MSLRFYYLSGSPFAWKVWLSLERKELPYEWKLLKADAGDTRRPEYRSINPHGKVPAISIDGFTLYESGAIVEYLEDRFPDRGRPLWPREVELRGIGRRISSEADAYLFPPIRRCVEQLLPRREGLPDEPAIASSRGRISEVLSIFESNLRGPFLLGDEPGGADFSVYPMVAILGRMNTRFPERSFLSLVPTKMQEWMARIEALPYFAKTVPPHWKTS